MQPGDKNFFGHTEFRISIDSKEAALLEQLSLNCFMMFDTFSNLLPNDIARARRKKKGG